MKTINLKPNGVGRYDNVSPFIVTDNSIHLQIALPPVNGEFYLVYENNGKKETRLIPRSGQIILEALSAGELNAEVKHYLKGELIKVYKIEPLLLKEVDGNLSAIPEIEELNRHICAVERDFKELVGRLERAEKNVISLIDFAYKDYCANVYLNGGSFEDFLKEFSVELTENQIKQLKGD